MASIEEKVEDYYKSLLDELGIRRFSKTEKINDSITNAFEQADSKSGGSGMNYPDIQLLLENNNRRNIPVSKNSLPTVILRWFLVEKTRIVLCNSMP